MTMKLCRKPGFAKRAEDYEETVSLCQSTRSDAGLNRLMIDKALALGTAQDLTPQERCLMMALLAHLDVQGTAADETAVWPGAGRLCTMLDIADSSLRRLKGSLEQKGFILRRYDHRNRPLKKGAIDLKPFLLKVPDLLASIGHTISKDQTGTEARYAERCEHRPIESAHPPKVERVYKRNPPTEISERTTSEIRKDDVAVLAEALLPSVTSNPDGHAIKLLGERKGPRLWSWAKRRHGERAALGLAVASTNPKVNDPAGWFGWFATTSTEVDLEGLGESLLRHRPSPLPAIEDPLVVQLIDGFAKEAGHAAATSYLAQAEAVASEGTLYLAPAGQTAKHRLAARFDGELSTAAEGLGYTGYVLCNRADFPPPPDQGSR